MTATIHSSELPRAGQFVAIWPVEGVLFAMTFLWDAGELLAYDTFADDWIVPDNGYDVEFLEAQEDIHYMRIEDDGE